MQYYILHHIYNMIHGIISHSEPNTPPQSLRKCSAMQTFESSSAEKKVFMLRINLFPKFTQTAYKFRGSCQFVHLNWQGISGAFVFLWLLRKDKASSLSLRIKEILEKTII